MSTTQSLTDKSVVLWIVVCNQDPEQTYVFTDPEKTMRSVEEGVRAYLDPFDTAEGVDEVLVEFRRNMGELWKDAVIPFRVFGMFMTIHRVELDRHNPLHILLGDVCSVLDGGGPDETRAVRDRVSALFRTPLS